MWQGAWRLLDPRDAGARTLIACYWNQTSHAGLLVIVNAAWHHATGVLDAGSLAGNGQRDVTLVDCFDPASAATYAPALLREQGLTITLPPWGTRAWRVVPSRSGRTTSSHG